MAAVQEIDVKKTIMKNFVMGGAAGIVGSLSTYPLDMVKTRLQNQRSVGSERLYKNSVDCFIKILRTEGVRGLYRGLPAQLVGITPEKAIKLTTNDMVRYYFTDKETGTIRLWQEVVAGACGGLFQVVATNPYEMVKVRLQTEQKGAGHQRKSIVAVAREVGFRGMYTGAGACLLRDVPFSAIYFSVYANLKVMIRSDPSETLGVGKLLVCGVGAGVVGAAAVTPADVVKTRLQVKGADKQYKGIVDCFTRIAKDEGPRALFKGTLPRVMIVSPLFGITLVTYETLQGLFP